MKKNAIAIWIYATLILIGGLMGFLKAGSIMSLVMSLAITGLLGWGGYLFWSNHPLGRKVNVYALSVILGVFIVRFLLTLKLVPAVLAGLTAIMLGYIIFSTKHSEYLD